MTQSHVYYTDDLYDLLHSKIAKESSCETQSIYDESEKLMELTDAPKATHF